MRKIHILLTQPVQSRKSFTQQNGILNCTKPNLFHQPLIPQLPIVSFLTPGTINRPGTTHSSSKMIARPITAYSFSIENSKLPNFPSGSYNGGLILGTSLKHLYQMSSPVLTSLNNITNLLQIKKDSALFSFFSQSSFYYGFVCGISVTACKKMVKQSSPEDTKSNCRMHFYIKRRSLFKRSITGQSSMTHFHTQKRLQFFWHRSLL